MNTIQIVTHYEEDDPDGDGDYLAVDVLVNDEIVMEYGDAYHDKGSEKADSFVAGVMHAVPGEYERLPDKDVGDGKIMW